MLRDERVDHRNAVQSSERYQLRVRRDDATDARHVHRLRAMARRVNKVALEIDDDERGA